MQDASGITRQKIEPAIKIADPQLAVLVLGQRGNITISQNGGAGLQNLFPSKSVGRQFEHAIPRQDVGAVFCPEELLHFLEIAEPPCVEAWAASGQRKANDALIFRAHKQILAVDDERSNQ